MIAALILSTLFATAPFDAERLLIMRNKYEEVTPRLEAHLKNGDCRGAVCEAYLAIALSKTKKTDRALAFAQEAVNKIAEEPLLDAWTANEIGAILFRAPTRTEGQLLSAATAFRFARAHYSGMASNIAFNLVETLKALGKTEEAAPIQKQLDARLLIDQTFAILGDFNGVGVERH